jgi:lysophospholipase L1-like esterase
VSAAAADRTLITSCDELRFQPPKDKGQAKLVEGKLGQAIQFSFGKDARSTFFTSNLRGTPEWDEAAGFSFWVKGDGSQACGGLQFIYDNDYALRYDYLFPINSTDWTKITVAWRDLIPVLPRPNAKLLDPKGENKPSKLSSLWIGKWWYWGEYPACSFAIDEIRLEPQIERDSQNYQPQGDPLARVKGKLKAGRPITIVTMGDSLTDYRHWANREVAWPKFLSKQLKDKYGSDVTIVNPAIGGTQLRQNLVLIPRWLDKAPEPDLVTICFGGNDWEAGMRGDLFREANCDGIDRIRRATKGKADVLLLSTVPSVMQWETRAELGAACRSAAKHRSAGLVDLEKAFWDAGQDNRERLFVRDKVHLSPAGHQLVADSILNALAP